MKRKRKYKSHRNTTSMKSMNIPGYQGFNLNCGLQELRQSVGNEKHSIQPIHQRSILSSLESSPTGQHDAGITSLQSSTSSRSDLTYIPNSPQPKDDSQLYKLLRLYEILTKVYSGLVMPYGCCLLNQEQRRESARSALKDVDDEHYERLHDILMPMKQGDRPYQRELAALLEWMNDTYQDLSACLALTPHSPMLEDLCKLTCQCMRIGLTRSRLFTPATK